MKLGIIAEDDSDVAVIRELTLTMLQSRNIGFKRFVGNGCGKLRRKCQAWAENLVRQGCSWIVLVHDLDTNDEKTLRRQLEGAIAHLGAQTTIVLIPIREIESWLMYDSRALRMAFNGHSEPRLPGDPESLQDPKKTLSSVVRQVFRKEYINTIHNERIAKHINPDRLCRARSFVHYPLFVENIRKNLH